MEMANENLKLLTEVDKQQELKMSNELTVQRKNELELCDARLEETSASAPKILCKKGVWSKGGEDIAAGSEFIAYPMDALRGACRWEDDRPVEQQIGRIADKFPSFKRENYPADEDWKPQVAMALEDPETGEIFTFVSASVGGKIAVEKLINQTASAVKRGTGDLTPLIRLAVSSFPSEEFGTIIRPSFEIVPRQSLKTELNDEIVI
jgi:hypothetical protein